MFISCCRKLSTRTLLFSSACVCATASIFIRALLCITSITAAAAVLTDRKYTNYTNYSRQTRWWFITAPPADSRLSAAKRRQEAAATSLNICFSASTSRRVEGEGGTAGGRGLRGGDGRGGAFSVLSQMSDGRLVCHGQPNEAVCFSPRLSGGIGGVGGEDGGR